MKAYKNLINRVLDNGKEREDRTGVGTFAVFGESHELDLADGFPIVTLRKIAYKQAFGELAAFLHGATTKTEFQSFGCSYWNTTGSTDELGPTYGAQWCKKNPSGLSQIEELMRGLILNPYSRRHILTTWNPQELVECVLPPCHIIAQFHISNEGYLNCIVYMRSVDIMLGLPYDTIVYATLMHIICNQLALMPGKLTFYFGDAHIYKNHIMAAIKLIKNEPQPLPNLQVSYGTSVHNFSNAPGELEVNAYYPLLPNVTFPLNL